MITTIRSYTELKRITTFEDRFKYLQLFGQIGIITFGFDRYINQKFYSSKEWKLIRNHVIVRDESSDLGIEDYPIFKSVYVHHMNPITIEDFENNCPLILDPEYLICTSLNTHNAIHFGDEKLLPKLPTERRRGDTTLW